MNASVEEEYLKKNHKFWAKTQFPFYLVDKYFRGSFWCKLAEDVVRGAPRMRWGAFGEKPWEATW